MGPFVFGFLVSIFLLFLVLVLLRLTIPYASRIFGQNSIPYLSSRENTDWFNYLSSRIFSHFQNPETIEQISRMVNEKIQPARLFIRSLGQIPRICSASTVQLPNPDTIRILFPLEWKGGPSIDLYLPKFKLLIELDIIMFKGTVNLNCPPTKDIEMEISFQDDIEFDFEMSFIWLSKYKFTLTRTPLIGPILKGILPLILLKNGLKINANFEIPDPLTNQK